MICSVGTQGSQHKGSDLQELELHVAMCHLICVLGIELMSFIRKVNTPSRASFPALKIDIL